MDRRCTIGVDIGGTKLLAGAVTADADVLHRVHAPVAGLGLEALLDVVESAVVEVSSHVGDEAAAVGFGIPSLIDRGAGVSVRCVHLPLDGVPFGELMRERLGRPVAVDNDVNAAVLAEWRWGAAVGASHVVMLTLGTGVGGGLVLDGRLYRGAIGCAGELGHMVVDADGPPCFGGCPSRGCLEALASGSALARDAAQAGLGSVTGEEVTRRAVGGDRAAVAVVQELGRRLGVGLDSVAMAFNPEMIVVGGGVMAAGELVLGPAREELARRALDPARRVRVVPATFGDNAGMLGAAMLAAEEAT